MFHLLGGACARPHIVCWRPLRSLFLCEHGESTRTVGTPEISFAQGLRRTGQNVKNAKIDWQQFWYIRDRCMFVMSAGVPRERCRVTNLQLLTLPRA